MVTHSTQFLQSELHSDSQVFFLGGEAGGMGTLRVRVVLRENKNVAWVLAPASVPSCCIEFVPRVSNRWQSMIGKAINKSISIDKIS